MSLHETERSIRTNWIAVFSYSASLALSLAIWTGLIRAIAHLVKY
jgi:hypothetical protein